MVPVYEYDHSLPSPEIQLHYHVNHKYDIWCLGWTLNFMMTKIDHFEKHKNCKFDNYFTINLPKFCGKFFNEIFEKQVFLNTSEN